MKRKISLLLLLILPVFGFSQKFEYATLLIPDSLKQNANAVVRLNQLDITISSQRKMKIYTKRVVTVLNEKGQSAIRAVEDYNKSTSITNIEATVYSSAGVLLKKIKRSDFKDQSAADGSTIFSDNRYLYLDYTPTEYPFTVCYESEVITSNTAFIPSWMPITEYYASIQKSILNVSCPEELEFKKKEFNFAGFNIAKIKDSPSQTSYEANTIPAQKKESYSPNFTDIFPRVMMGLTFFHLEGVDGNAKTWEEFGKWYSEKILTGTTELPEETKSKIKALVGNETDPIKKAKIVYKYVQEKSRYVSIQVGIGGWKPMYAKDVDRLGYGDCKALSNYTRALLEAVGVTSYNTILFGSNDKIDIQTDFVSMQGNHMILCLPNNGNYIWLECTSQDDPFGYQGTFTDDRQVVILKPDGGQVLHTRMYPDNENIQISKGSYAISGEGALSGKISIHSEGSQYSARQQIQKMLPAEKEGYYKDYWSNINNLKITKAALDINKETISAVENLEISASGYGALNGNTMMLAVNAYNQSDNIPPRYRKRSSPFEIERGFADSDEIEITLPQNFTLDAKPNNVELKQKFGTYKSEIIVVGPDKIIYKRELKLYKGRYDKSEYDDYRKFMEQISKADTSKIVLTKT